MDPEKTEREETREKNGILRRLASSGLTLLIALAIFIVSAFAWFALGRTLASYAPVARPESLFIGAGHRNYDSTNHEFTDDHFENIRYLYFNGIDLDEGIDYYDYVFCIFGTTISGYRLQIAYTTNNQFDYEIYPASESTVSSAGAVEYTTHEATPHTYYYSVSGAKLTGSFLNLDTSVQDEKIANQVKHTATYGSYNAVDKYGEPLYWQTPTINVEQAARRHDFIHYYILRVIVNDKENNDRETDVICIAAKSYSAGS